MSSDERLDREWEQQQSSQSFQRPQSTMARSFSLALNDLFKIDGSLADLDAAVDQKKKAVSTQTSELEALEARLKATEERLKLAATNTNSPGRSGRSSPRPRAPLGDTFDPPKEAHTTSPLASELRTSRPSTARREVKDGRQESYRTPPMPGALPPTPGASEGESDPEYVVVRRADLEEDGDAPRLGH